MLWITNTIDGVEASVLWRFAYCLEFKPFTRRERTELWVNILNRHKVRHIFQYTEIEELARDFDLSPGMVDLAVFKAKETCCRRKRPIKQTMRMGLESHAKVMNEGRLPGFRKSRKTTPWKA